MLILAAFADQSVSSMPATANADEEFADFASFQATPSPSSASHSATESQPVTKTEADTEMPSLAGYQPAFTFSLSVPNNNPSTVSGTGGALDKYQLIKEMISDPSMFTSGTSPAVGLTEDGKEEWSDYQGLSSSDVVHAGVQNTSDAECPRSLFPDDGEWANFQSTSAVGASVPYQSVRTFQGAASSSLPDFDIEEPPPVKAKSVYSSDGGWFGIQRNNPAHHKPSHALFSSGALDFSPPELPPENDDDDTNDLGFYSVRSGDGDQGISSLSTVDLEDDPVEGVRGGSDFLKCEVPGMTTSNSTSSFEFTGWQHGSKNGLQVPAADTQSTHSLDLQPTSDTSKRSSSRLAAEADSQSENSFEFVPPSETKMPASIIAGVDSDRMSLQSLELKSTIASPDDEPSYGIGRDDFERVTCQSLGGLDNVPINSGMPSFHY